MSPTRLPSDPGKNPEHHPTESTPQDASVLRHERQRVAQLLHNTVCQELTGISLMASASAHQCRASHPELAQRMEEIADLIQRTGANLGQIMHGLREGGAGDAPAEPPAQA